MPHTVRLHRVLATKPEKIYRAFLEADALAKWLPPNGFTCTVHELVAKAGGRFKMSFRNFTTGDSQSFGGEYLELAPYEVHGQIRRSQSAGSNPDGGDAQESVTRDGVAHCAGRSAGRYPAGGLLPRLAAVPLQLGQAC